MKDNIVKHLFYIYFPLTLFEFALGGPLGSFLKYFGIIIIAIWLMIRLIDKRNIIVDASIVFFALWLLVSFISVLWSSDMNTGIYYFFASANMLTISWVILNLDWEEKEMDTIMLLMELSGALFCLLMIIKRDLYHGVGIRYTLNLSGVELDPNNIAGLIIPSNLIAINFMLKRRRIVTHTLVFLLTIIGIVMAGSRGGILAILAGILVYLVLYSVGKRKKRRLLNNKSHYRFLRMRINTRNIAYFVIFALSMYIMFDYINRNVDKDLINRISLASILNNSDNGSERISIWQDAINLYKDNILFGLGLGGFGGLTGLAVHNQYLRILVEAGPLALLLFICGILSIIRTLYRVRNDLGISMMVSMLIVIFFLDAFQKKYMWNPIILSMIFIKRYYYQEALQVPCDTRNCN